MKITFIVPLLLLAACAPQYSYTCTRHEDQASFPAEKRQDFADSTYYIIKDVNEIEYRIDASNSNEYACKEKKDE